RQRQMKAVLKCRNNLRAQFSRKQTSHPSVVSDDRCDARDTAALELGIACKGRKIRWNRRGTEQSNRIAGLAREIGYPSQAPRQNAPKGRGDRHRSESAVFDAQTIELSVTAHKRQRQH